jgi:peptidoglycan/xylan/chitin deacetylase (PgdA/CDA1 family)
MNSCKAKFKKYFGAFFYYSGLFHAIRTINNIRGRRLTILTFHRVSSGDDVRSNHSLPYLFISNHSFEKQLKFIKKHYNVISFRQLKKYIDNETMPWNCMIISFDDGYKDNYEIAYPLLKKYDFSFIVFLVTDKIENEDTKPFWWDKIYYYLQILNMRYSEEFPPELGDDVKSIATQFKRDPSGVFSKLNNWNTSRIESSLEELENILNVSEREIVQANRMLDWDDINTMSKITEFGSHSCTHRNLLSISMDELERELQDSKKIIEKKAKQKVLVFSSPHGNVSDTIADKIRAAGYEFAVSCEKGINRINEDRYHLKRINIWEGTSRLSDNHFSKGFFAYKLLGF